MWAVLNSRLGTANLSSARCAMLSARPFAARGRSVGCGSEPLLPEL